MYASVLLYVNYIYINYIYIYINYTKIQLSNLKKYTPSGLQGAGGGLFFEWTAT